MTGKAAAGDARDRESAARASEGASAASVPETGRDWWNLGTAPMIPVDIPVEIIKAPAVTCKVTKRLADMEPIETLPEVLRATSVSGPRRGDVVSPGRRERRDG